MSSEIGLTKNPSILKDLVLFLILNTFQYTDQIRLQWFDER